MSRNALAVVFLEGAGWGDARLEPLPGDASARCYVRLRRHGETAILMDAPPMTAAVRPYAITAHLALDCEPFVAIGACLRERGLSAPALLAHDIKHGLLLLEDLGVEHYHDAPAGGGQMETMLGAAVDALLRLHSSPLPEALPVPGGGHYSLPLFGVEVFLAEVALFTRWYRPEVPDATLSSADVREEQTLWRTLYERHVSGAPAHLMLRDFHSPNLMWLPERHGVARVGILDYQDALLGPGAYDLVSLLQDARQDIPPALETIMLDKYISAMQRRYPDFDPQAFRASYAVLGAQRSVRIMGVFTRLWRRDNKPEYRAHLPRMAGYLARNLAHPALEAMARRFAQTPWHPVGQGK